MTDFKTRAIGALEQLRREVTRADQLTDQREAFGVQRAIEILRALPEEPEHGPSSEMVEALRQRPMIGDDDAPAAQGEPEELRDDWLTDHEQRIVTLEAKQAETESRIDDLVRQYLVYIIDSSKIAGGEKA